MDVRSNAALAAEDEQDYRNLQSLVFSDKLFNGQRFELRASFRPHGYSTGGTRNGQTTPASLSGRLYLVLHSVSPAYYRYRKSWVRHIYNQGVKDEGYGYDLRQLLFLGDPTALYTNVTGGYGVAVGLTGETRNLPLR